MSEEAYYELLGTPVALHVGEGCSSAALERLLGPFRRAPCDVADERRFSIVCGDGGSHTLRRDKVVVSRPSSVDQLLTALLSHVNVLAVEGFDGFAVHAGVVARNGRVTAFPAASGAGKSTLTAACLGVGFDYVSDEALCVAYDSGAVVPYPKPLSLSLESFTLAGVSPPTDHGAIARGDELVVDASYFAARPATGDLRLANIVVPDRTPGPPVLRPLPRSDGLARLLRLSFNHYKRPSDTFRLVSRLAGEAEVFGLDYDDPRVAAELLLGQLG